MTQPLTLTPPTAGTTLDAEGFAAWLAERREPAWLSESRRQAWQRFAALPWPGGRDEEWTRTDIRTFHLDPFTLRPPSGPAPQGVLATGVDLAGQAITLNGQAVRAEFDESLRARGVLFGSLPELIAEHPERIRPHLHRAVDASRDRFAALHAAFWSSGLLLLVPRGVAIDRPLHALAALEEGGTDLGHTLVILEEGAAATLMTEQRSVSGASAGLHCGAVELLLAPEAHLRFVQLQDWGPGVWHFSHQRAMIDRDASLQWTLAALGGRLAKVNQQVALVGSGASSQVNGVLFTQGRQHLSYHTLQHHLAPHGTSDFLYKAALQDESRTVWRGMIKVDPRAQKTDGYQRNDNLMLSKRARADSIPGLEIEADDVRCTHGSTSGRVDEELIYYARTRGLRRNEAIRLIVSGFFQQIFDRITIDSVREALGQAIARRVRDSA